MNCYQPVLISKNLDKEKFPDGLLVPCGKCLACKEEVAKEYTLRFQHERIHKGYKKLAFLTLTYDSINLPINNFHMTLRKKDAVDYLKRTRESLRRKMKDTNQKLLNYCYYLSGEYGEERNRPHYHIVLAYNNKRILNEFVRQWENNKGQVNCQERASIQSVYYTIGYVDKKIGLQGVGEDRERLFRKFTKGMGREYILENAELVNKQMFCRLSKFKISIPRYYKKKLSEIGLWTSDKETYYKIMERKKESDEKLLKLYNEKYIKKESYTRKPIQIGHTIPLPQYDKIKDRLKSELNDFDYSISIKDGIVKIFNIKYEKTTIDEYKNSILNQRKLNYECKAKLRKEKRELNYDPL